MGESLRRLCVRTLECDAQLRYPRFSSLSGGERNERLKFDSDYPDEDDASPFFFLGEFCTNPNPFYHSLS